MARKTKAELNEKKVEFKSPLGDPPSILSGEALAVWKEVAPQLSDAGIAKRVSADALSCYCQAVADYHDAQKAIEEHGMITVTERGFAKNPACTLKNQAFTHILRFASAFGLTPASASRLPAPKDAPEANPYAKFAKKTG